MKQTLLQKLLSILKTEQPELIVDKYDQTMLRMSLIGLLDSIESIAKAGKIAVNGSTTLPIALLRLYLNGIVNSCAIAEKAMSKDKRDSAEDGLDKPLPSEKVEPVADKPSLQTDTIDGDAFDFLVKTFKRKK